MTMEGRGQLTVNLCVLEFPCWNVILKHQVNFAKGTILSLRQPEPAPNCAKKISSCIEEAGFCAPVPSCGNGQLVLHCHGRLAD